VLAAQRLLAESAGGTYHHLADQDVPAALLVGNVKSRYIHEEARPWETRISPAPGVRHR
jgi:hypothetical protein